MDQTATQAGASFVVAVLTARSRSTRTFSPAPGWSGNSGWTICFIPSGVCERSGERLGFPVTTIAESLQVIATEKGVYLHGFPNTVMGRGHWNEMGHLWAAQLLANELCAKNLLQ